MEFFENKENNKKNSKRLLGKGTQMPSPSAEPSPARRYKNAFTKAEAVSSPRTDWKQTIQKQRRTSSNNIQIALRAARTNHFFVQLITRRSSVQICPPQPILLKLQACETPITGPSFFGKEITLRSVISGHPVPKNSPSFSAASRSSCVKVCV